MYKTLLDVDFDVIRTGLREIGLLEDILIISKFRGILTILIFSDVNSDVNMYNP